MKNKKMLTAIPICIIIALIIYIGAGIRKDDFKGEGPSDKIQLSTETADGKGEEYFTVKKLNNMESVISLRDDFDKAPLDTESIRTIFNDFQLNEIDLIRTISVVAPLEEKIPASQVNLNDAHEIKLTYGYFNTDEKYSQNYFFDFYHYDLNVKWDSRQYESICDDLDNGRMFFSGTDYQNLIHSLDEGDLKYLFFGNEDEVNGLAIVKEENGHVYIMKSIYQNLSNEYVEKGQYYAPFGSVEDAEGFVKSSDVSGLFSELSDVISGLGDNMPDNSEI